METEEATENVEMEPAAGEESSVTTEAAEEAAPESSVTNESTEAAAGAEGEGAHGGEEEEAYLPVVPPPVSGNDVATVIDSKPGLNCKMNAFCFGCTVR